MPNNNQQHCMTFKINEDGSHNAAEIADFVKADSWDVNGDKLTLFNLVLVGKAQFSATNGEDIIISGLNGEEQNSKVELQADIDQLLKTRIPILDQIYDVCQAIEKCGASPELTDAVTKAGALRDPISKLVNQALKLGIGEGIVCVSYSDNGSNSTQDLPELKYDESVNSSETPSSTQARADGGVGVCIHRSKLLDNRENAYLLTQLLNTPNINSELRKKAEAKMTALLDELI